MTAASVCVAPAVSPALCTAMQKTWISPGSSAASSAVSSPVRPPSCCEARPEKNTILKEALAGTCVPHFAAPSVFSARLELKLRNNNQRPENSTGASFVWPSWCLQQDKPNQNFWSSWKRTVQSFQPRSWRTAQYVLLIVFMLRIVRLMVNIRKDAQPSPPPPFSSPFPFLATEPEKIEVA